MCVWICVASFTPEEAIRNDSTAQSRYSLRSSLRRGSPSRSAGSSIWIIRMPEASRSRTSSRMARAICRQVTDRGWSSRTKDHARMVTGPVSIPFNGLRVRDWA